MPHVTPFINLLGVLPIMPFFALMYYTCVLVRVLSILNKPTAKLSTDDHIQMIWREHIKAAYEKNQTHTTFGQDQNPRGKTVYRRNLAVSNFDKSFNAKLYPAFIKARVREQF